MTGATLYLSFYHFYVAAGFGSNFFSALLPLPLTSSSSSFSCSVRRCGLQRRAHTLSICCPGLLWLVVSVVVVVGNFRNTCERIKQRQLRFVSFGACRGTFSRLLSFFLSLVRSFFLALSIFPSAPPPLRESSLRARAARLLAAAATEAAIAQQCIVTAAAASLLQSCSCSGRRRRRRVRRRPSRLPRVERGNKPNAHTELATIRN